MGGDVVVNKDDASTVLGMAMEIRDDEGFSH